MNTALDQGNDSRHRAGSDVCPFEKHRKSGFGVRRDSGSLLVLLLSIAVLVLERLSIVYRQLLNAVKLQRHPSQYRNDSLKHYPHTTTRRVVQYARRNENVLNRSELKRRPTSDVEKPRAILSASFAVALRDVERNRQRGR